MMKRLIFLILLFSSKYVFTQKYINLERDKALQQLSLFSEKFKQKPVIEIADSNIKYSTQDSLQRHFSFTLHFDSVGKCDVETHSWDCDFCFRKTLDWELKKSHLRWSKISNTTYLSKARKHLMLELSENNLFSFVIRRTMLSSAEAAEMLHNKQTQ